MTAGRSSAATPVWLQAAPVLFLLFWSAGFTFGKLGLEHAEPMTFLALRYASVLVVLLPLVLLMRPPLPARAIDWAHLAAVGTLIQGVYFGLTY